MSNLPASQIATRRTARLLAAICIGIVIGLTVVASTSSLEQTTSPLAKLLTALRPQP